MSDALESRRDELKALIDVPIGFPSPVSNIGSVYLLLRGWRGVHQENPVVHSIFASKADAELMRDHMEEAEPSFRFGVSRRDVLAFNEENTDAS